MKKVSFNKWNIIQKTLQPLFGAVSVLWLFGIMIQFIHSTISQNYDMFKEYGQIALTVFGFTLIGGIFENRKKRPEIVKKLFDSSLSFLITAIAFFFMYSLSSVFTKEMSPMGNIQETLIVVSFSIAMIIGYYGIISGLLNLYRILIDYRISLTK
ncbi:MAG: hypothetical protein KAW45_02225 [Thermoplasmatales archaeon]|nr:hypothetical protein [Thermoplasmatales archaeon]